MKKLTKKQNKLWNKAKLYHALRDLPDAPPCCYNCHYWKPLRPCLFKKEIDYYMILKAAPSVVKNNKSILSWDMSLLPGKTVRELKVPLCNKYFEKK